jgi:flagellar basal-body rod protein FlgB
MSNPTEVVTAGLMRLALDGAALRHQAIAANIANATTAGYKPVRVSFEGRLQQARDRLQAGDALQDVAAELGAVVERDDTPGATVAVDLQAADLAQNVVHYQALLKGWGKRMSIMATAINEGKR